MNERTISSANTVSQC